MSFAVKWRRQCFLTFILTPHKIKVIIKAQQGKIDANIIVSLVSFDPVKLGPGVVGTVVEEKNFGIVVEEGCIGVAEVGPVDVEKNE